LMLVLAMRLNFLLRRVRSIESTYAFGGVGRGFPGSSPKVRVL
jgi:hypothetical protein